MYEQRNSNDLHLEFLVGFAQSTLDALSVSMNRRRDGAIKYNRDFQTTLCALGHIAHFSLEHVASEILSPFAFFLLSYVLRSTPSFYPRA